MSQLDKNLTWGEFKKMVESQGVNDDTTIGDIIWVHAYVPEVILGADGVPTAIVNGGGEVAEDDDFDGDDVRDEDWDEEDEENHDLG